MPDLDRLASQHLAAALTSDRGRSAELVLHDGELRQTLIALAAGTELGEHNAPPAASLQVLRGRVQVSVEGGAEEISTGELWLLTHERHAVTAMEDTVFLLTTVTNVER